MPQLSAQTASSAGSAGTPRLARKLGPFDATMIVMGGIIGSGIFINPYVVATEVHTPALILGAWLAGGAIALLGAFIYAELAARMPAVGGQYAYLREAYHPLIAFLYGWVLLLVVQTGGMAAVSVTFANYLLEVTGWHAPVTVAAAIALTILTIINCLGVRQGSGMQSALMMTKILALGVLIVFGWSRVHPAAAIAPQTGVNKLGLLSAFGAAMVPVLFSYGGWQTANFVAGEMRNPQRDLPRGLLIGVLGVIALYVGANFVYVRALGPAGLAAANTPASAVMRLAFGQRGATFIALGISISALGFLSQSILTAPRVYFAMAEDGVFFRAVAMVSARTHVPVIAIGLQSVWTIVIALTSAYKAILAYVVAMDFLFFGLTATCIFVFRRRDGERHAPGTGLSRTPAHPVTTLIFIAACWIMVANTIYRFPQNSLIGMGILLLGVPVYFCWRLLGRSK
jgi:APA family basic amino acid/polyamine antiporter